jgi:ABC-type lipoprotein export system ATPase subunit
MLQLQQITKTFEDGINRRNHVLRGVNLSVEAGEFIAVVGASGAGKSTLLKIIGTLLLPDEGSIFFDGEDLTAAKANLAEVRNRKIGFVFQDHCLLPQLTAWENVLLPALAAASKSASGQEARAQRLMQMLGVEHAASQLSDSLSGGEAQRVALCRALVMNPKLLLADEPTGQLDSRNAQQVAALFAEVAKTTGSAVIMVTHSKETAAAANRILTLSEGILQ